METPQNLQAGDQVLAGTLFRRIPLEDIHWVRAEKRPTWNNFKPSKTQDHLSVQLASMVSPEQILKAYPDFGLFEISVEVLRDAGFTVTYQPTGGVDHAAVWGTKDTPKSVLRKLCSKILRVWSPEDQSLVLDRTAEASEPAT